MKQALYLLHKISFTSFRANDSVVNSKLDQLLLLGFYILFSLSFGSNYPSNSFPNTLSTYLKPTETPTPIKSTEKKKEKDKNDQQEYIHSFFFEFKSLFSVFMIKRLRKE